MPPLKSFIAHKKDPKWLRATACSNHNVHLTVYKPLPSLTYLGCLSLSQSVYLRVSSASPLSNPSKLLDSGQDILCKRLCVAYTVFQSSRCPINGVCAICIILTKRLKSKGLTTVRLDTKSKDLAHLKDYTLDVLQESSLYKQQQ